MRVGLLFGLGPDALGPGGSYEEAMGQIAIADRLGLDSVLFEEHHGSRGVPVPGSLAAAAAARTTAIRVGSSNRQCTLEYPINVAADWAVLDLISRGRSILGVSPGERPQDFRAAGIPWESREGRFREAVELIRTAWTQDSFQLIGEHYRFPLSAEGEPGWRREPYEPPYLDQWRRGQVVPQFLPLTPKPVQVPHPPIWVSAWRRETIEWAARRGLTFLCSSLDTEDEARTRLGWHLEALQASGRDAREVEVAIAREVYVAESAEEARRIALPSLRRHIEAVHEEATAEQADLAVVQGLDETKLLDACALVGSPAEIVDRLKALQADLGITHLVCRVFLPGRRHFEVAEAIRLLASQVQTRLVA